MRYGNYEGKIFYCPSGAKFLKIFREFREGAVCSKFFNTHEEVITRFNHPSRTFRQFLSWAQIDGLQLQRFTGTRLMVPSLNQWFELSVDYTHSHPDQIVSLASQEGYPYLGPPFQGKGHYRAQIIRISSSIISGSPLNLGTMRLRASARGYRLLEGQAAAVFATLYSPDGKGDIWFGGSEWKSRWRDGKVFVVLGQYGGKWRFHFYRDETNFFYPKKNTRLIIVQEEE